ncbi:MAG: hypothetical protein HY823_01405 [Acidobacteria bacterium]|nr:hypothetical protein [Acidobacteriota bacterium]
MRFALLSLCLLSGPLVAQTPEVRAQRLAEAARLWARVKWVHPALAQGRIDWDKALLEAMPDLAEAQNDAARKAALHKLMAPLGDPALRIGPREQPIYVKADPKFPRVAWLPGDVALLQLHQTVSGWDSAFAPAVAEVKAALAKAKGVVVDLRLGGPPYGNPSDLVDRVVSHLVLEPLTLPAPRFLYNYGFPPQNGNSSGGYFKAWMTQAARQLTPEALARPLPVAFLANAWTPIPPSVLALQRSGRAWVVTEGPLHAGWVVPTEDMTLAGGLEVTFSSGELVFADGSTGFASDRVVAQSLQVGPETPGVQAARALLDGSSKPGAGLPRHPLAPQPLWAPDPAYPGSTFPDLSLRRLAVIRLWAVMEAFFPYKDLMDRPWEAALPEFLARMETVTDGRGYALAIAEMAARLQDNHVWVSGPEIRQHYGDASLPVELTVVQGRVVVAHVLDAKAAAGVQRWDEVLEVDGEAVQTAIQRLSQRLTSANPWTRDRNVVHYGFLGRGTDGSQATLKLRTGDGAIRTVRLPRTKAFWQMEAPKPEGEIIRILEGNLGYADLGRLELSQVDELFEKVKHTRGLILDMRGYPHGTAWTLAPRLNVKGATLGPLFTPSLQFGGDSERTAPRMTWTQKLPPGDGKPLYRGKVVMLMNELSQSQAEHSGLFFEAVCDITFIGSPTAGSNGDVTNLLLPGELRVSFTGQGVRHGDGRQLQRVGLQPHIPVTPTIEGLKAGRDEVLERAVQFMTAGR